MQLAGHDALADPQIYGAQLGVPATPATSVHVPFCPPVSAAEQKSHAPPQAVLQQKPSAQNPEAHCRVSVHAPPLTCGGTHCPFALHQSPAAHWASLAHETGQLGAVPSHTYAPHEGEPA